jgi:DNA-directed RNA polymerase alpha subunit
MDILELDFTVFTYNALKRGGINTLDELLMKSDAELLSIRNLNNKRLKEIHEILDNLQQTTINKWDELRKYIIFEKNKIKNSNDIPQYIFDSILSKMNKLDGEVK